MRWLSLVVVLMFAGGAGPSCAEIIFSDDFSYPDGPLVQLAPDKWKTHSGTAGQVEVIGGEVRLSQKKSEDVSTVFERGTLNATNTPTLYAAFTVQFATLPSGLNGGYFAHFKDGTTTTGIRCRVFATTNGAASGRFRVGVAAATNAPTALVPQDLTLRTPYRLVCRLGLGNAASALWVNPRSEKDPAALATDQAASKNVVAFALRQSLASGAGMGELLVDNLRVATSFPETVAGVPPRIRVQPQSQVVPTGTELRLVSEAMGTEPLLYQWLWNGAELPGAAEPTLVLASVSRAQEGTYQVVVANEFGDTISEEAVVTVTSPPLTLAIEASPDSSVRLSWAADPNQSYSVWSGDWETGIVNVLAGSLFFPNGVGRFEEARADVPARFYRVCADGEVW